MQHSAAESGAHRQSASVLILFAVLMLLLHVRSFYVPHQEGDERAYLTLAGAMGWDGSNYTTREDPVVSAYPFSIYRQPLFHHPPLYPLVLKLGLALGEPVLAGLVFQIAAMGLLLVFARRAARIFSLPEEFHAAFQAALTSCPLLLFSTTRLHVDGLLAVFAFCAFTMFVESLDARSGRKAVLAGLLFVLTLNVRYNALLLLPLIPAFQLFHLYRAADARGGSWRRVLGDLAHWKCFAIVSLFVLILGLPHYYRILATYGTLDPTRFVIADANVAAWNDFMRRVYARSRLQLSVYLISIYPMLLTWLSLPHLRLVAARVRERSWEPMYLMVALTMLAAHLAAPFPQLRYYAVTTPFMLLWFVLQIRAADAGARRLLWQLAALTLLLMAVTAFGGALFLRGTAEVVPAAFVLFPPLRPFY